MSGTAPPQFSFKTVEMLLMRLAGVPEEQRTAFMGRFQYFQRMDFPVGRVGRGRKVSYGFAEVWQLVLAFELLQVGTSPVRAVRLVRTSWAAARLAVAQAWSVSRPRDRQVLALFPSALSDLVPEVGAERRPARDPIGVLTAADLAEWLLEAEDGDPELCVIIDPRRLACRMVSQLEGFGVGDARRGMDEFAAAVRSG